MKCLDNKNKNENYSCPIREQIANYQTSSAFLFLFSNPNVEIYL